MTFKKWITFSLFLILIYRTLAVATPQHYHYPQAVPPAMVTGLLGVVCPNFILKESILDMTGF